MSKLYIGQKVMFDIGEVEAQLRNVEAKMESFISKYAADIEGYQRTATNLT